MQRLIGVVGAYELFRFRAGLTTVETNGGIMLVSTSTGECSGHRLPSGYTSSARDRVSTHDVLPWDFLDEKNATHAEGRLQYADFEPLVDSVTGPLCEFADDLLVQEKVQIGAIHVVERDGEHDYYGWSISTLANARAMACEYALTTNIADQVICAARSADGLGVGCAPNVNAQVAQDESLQFAHFLLGEPACREQLSPPPGTSPEDGATSVDLEIFGVGIGLTWEAAEAGAIRECLKRVSGSCGELIPWQDGVLTNVNIRVRQFLLAAMGDAFASGSLQTWQSPFGQIVSRFSRQDEGCHEVFTAAEDSEEEATVSCLVHYLASSQLAKQGIEIGTVLGCVEAKHTPTRLPNDIALFRYMHPGFGGGKIRSAVAVSVWNQKVSSHE